MNEMEAAVHASILEKYSRGRRGAPAKGVDRIYPVREFKSLLLRHESPCKSRTFSFFTTQNPIPPHTRIFYKAPSLKLGAFTFLAITHHTLGRQYASCVIK